MNIKDSVFLISGGASGLGAATARMIVANGGKVVLADMNRDAGAALAAEFGPNALFVPTDVTDESACQSAIDATVTHFGALHGLACCAGIAPGEKVLGKEGPHGIQTFVRALEINVVGTFNLIRLASAVMSQSEPNEEGERGTIIMTASVAAYDGQVGQAAYSASKAAVVGMTLPIARELARYGIRVMTIAPGIFETPMLLGLPSQVRESLGRSVPFPSRLGRPAEFALLVKAICENPMLNGEVIRLDGALRMAAK
ncbi:NAD(P)-dependent dehydrogenase (short-subunit alcohol dehydrogenase family) [Paraburkholderia sp. EB58]|jgi:NAD(P)-dependent dehydrogenase (short-subunit alcohol dehydrogenase family)|uniref:3-hydroxyacyl-CoA dehydrogenase n=1 Tax=Paraburkholderia sp. EB58 TaxID=3035125 RepID=UPI003D2141DB